jgi:XTP/dITP diphosphohydrolase
MSYNNTDILVATTNPGKVKELTTLLGRAVKVNLISLDSFKDIEDIKEDGDTFEENARKKAKGYAKKTGLWTLADDSGLVVDALDGAPGVKSARFSGEKIKSEDRTLIDHRNIAKVLKMLDGVTEESRTARFICNLCLASTEEVLIETKGILEGFITGKEIGENGFGYDPIFFVSSLNKTVAQLTAEEKNAISHRGNAIREFKYKLEELMKKKKGG